MLGRIFLGSLYGFIASLAWAFALHYPLMSGWLYGVIIGSVISLVLYFISLAGAARGNVTKQEAFFLANLQSFFILVAAIVSALVALIIRLVFF